MKIRNVEAFKVKVPVREDAVYSKEYLVGEEVPPFYEIPKYVFRLYTDDGLVGVGESYRGVSLESVEDGMRSVKDVEIDGLNLRDLPINTEVYVGFETAIFDVVGKLYGVPAYKLLGGTYRKGVYVSFWTSRRTPEDLAERAEVARRGGFDGMKIKCKLGDPMVERLEAVEEAVGPEFYVVLDPNERFYNPAETIKLMRKLEKYNIPILESPVPQWNLDWYVLLRRKINVPLAIHVSQRGPREAYGMHQTIEAIKKGAIDYLNVSAGLVDFTKIAAIAEAAGIQGKNSPKTWASRP
ncbi:MAG: enolase C-terminal domain-like protein [Candidatus Bathyarchaeia archaeon]